MTLQLLVNHYRESEDIVKCFLNSVEKQIGIQNGSFEVVIFSDGEDFALNTELFTNYSFPIIYHVLDHHGVCVTRNALLDFSSADYLMFCDVDDEFHSSFGLYWILKAIADTKANIIGSPYEEEIFSESGMHYIRKTRDTIRLHGKAFKRQYLIDQKIRFPDELQYSGDMYFLWLAYNLEHNYAWTHDSFYTWKWNPSSITRSDKQHTIRSYPILMKNYTLLADNLRDRKRDDLLKICVCRTICMAFLDTYSEAFINASDDLVSKAIDSVRNYIDAYGDIFKELSYDFITESLTASFTNHPNCKSLTASDLTEWVDRLRS